MSYRDEALSLNRYTAMALAVSTVFSPRIVPSGRAYDQLSARIHSDSEYVLPSIFLSTLHYQGGCKSAEEASQLGLGVVVSCGCKLILWPSEDCQCVFEWRHHNSCAKN